MCTHLQLNDRDWAMCPMDLIIAGYAVDPYMDTPTNPIDALDKYNTCLCSFDMDGLLNDQVGKENIDWHYNGDYILGPCPEEPSPPLPEAEIIGPWPEISPDQLELW